MARLPFWQHAWDAAGPRLATIRTTLESGARGPEAPRLRVGQLDSESLDHELLQLLREPIYKSLDILNVRSICPRTTDPQQSNCIFLIFSDTVEGAVRARADVARASGSVQVLDLGPRRVVRRQTAKSALHHGLSFTPVRPCARSKAQPTLLIRDPRLGCPGTSSSRTLRSRFSSHTCTRACDHMPSLRAGPMRLPFRSSAAPGGSSRVSSRPTASSLCSTFSRFCTTGGMSSHLDWQSADVDARSAATERLWIGC